MGNVIKHHWNTTVTGGLVTAVLNEPISENDENANEFSVYVQNANFESATCKGFFIRGDGKTIVLNGQVSGKTASVVLAPNCYNVKGRFTITVKVKKGESDTSWLRVKGYVEETITDDYAFAGDDSAPLDILLEAAERVDEAVSEANEAAAAANEAAQAAENALESVEETLAAIQEDYTELAGEVSQLSQEIGKIAADLDANLLTKAPAIFVDASGDLVHITDGAAMPVKSLITHIEPVQEGEGDPSPDNVRPISGWDNVSAHQSGANLINAAYLQTNRATFNISEDTYTVDVTGAASYSHAFYDIESKIKPGVTLYLAMDGAESTTDGIVPAVQIEVIGDYPMRVNINKEIPATSFVMPESFSAIRVKYYANTTSVDLAQSNTCTFKGVRLSCVNDEWKPYQGKTLTYDLPETVYGGTPEWTTGVVTVSKKLHHIDGTSVIAALANENNNNRISFDLGAKSTAYTVNDAICNIFPYREDVYYNTAKNVGFAKDGNRLFFRLPTDVDGMSAQAIHAYFAANPTDVVYTLETPYTIQLTPKQLSTLKGTNNIWSDAGETEVTYAADTKMYIDQKIAAIAAAIVNE